MKSKNPLLTNDFSKVEQRLVELYAGEVKKHIHEIGTDDSLYIGLITKELVRGNNYNMVQRANSSLLSRKFICDSIGLKGEETAISGYRMGEGDGKLIVKIPKAMLEYFIEVAEQPYILYAARFTSDYDRPLYKLMDAVADISNTLIENEVTVNGIKIMVYPSAKKGKGWSHLLLTDLDKLLRFDGYLKPSENNFNFAEIKRSILLPRFNFFSSKTDLDCELSNRQGPVKVTGIDIRATRQAVDSSSVLYSGFSEYQLYALLQRLFSGKKQADLLAASLTQHQILKVYLTTNERFIYYNSEKITREKRSDHDWATLIVAAAYPELGVSHEEITIRKKEIRFKQIKKELAA